MALKIRLIIDLSFMNFDIEYLISMLYYMAELWLFRVQNAGHRLLDACEWLMDERRGVSVTGCMLVIA
ncbi:MAG: hypothetical protein JRF56_13915 [Deltaproteobacteria bacterium]|jgi:hypothetical protein|nr:hypothetical protein [Deltaproteobacteria bacterium]